PSKALIRFARLAHDQLHSVCSGVGTGEVRVDFSRVMAEVRAVIARVYSNEAPEVLAKRGIEVALGPVRFRRRREPPGRRPSRRRKELAGESINELALAIDRGLSVSDVASTIHAYPTFAFVIFWIAWWLVADLFSGTHASAATSKSSDDGRTRSARGERPAISH